MNIKVCIVALLLLPFIIFNKIMAQWSPPPNSTNFITTTHTSGASDFGFDLEESGNNTELFIENNSGGVNQQVFYFGHANAFKNIFGISTSINSGTDWISRFVINQNGNIGIGTSSPQSKLMVNGKITAREIQVTINGWPDSVFLYDYRLRPLNEVEAFILENGHLPEVPSAKEVEENGIDLGEMDAKLLQKIEELTLYVIEQNKKIQELTTEIETLKSK